MFLCALVIAGLFGYKVLTAKMNLFENLLNRYIHTRGRLESSGAAA